MVGADVGGGNDGSGGAGAELPLEDADGGMGNPPDEDEAGSYAGRCSSSLPDSPGSNRWLAQVVRDDSFNLASGMGSNGESCILREGTHR